MEKANKLGQNPTQHANDQRGILKVWVDPVREVSGVALISNVVDYAETARDMKSNGVIEHRGWHTGEPPNGRVCINMLPDWRE